MRACAAAILAGLALASAVGATATTRPSTFEQTAIRRDAAPLARPQAPSRATQLGVDRVLLALGVVVAAALAARWGVRRLFPASASARSSRAIRVIARSALAPRQQVLLLQVGRRLIVVGDTGQTMTALSEISDPDEVAQLVGQIDSEAPGSTSTAFASLFRGGAAEASPPGELPGAARRSGDPEAVDEARHELGGLAERIRLLAKQMHKTG